MALVLDLTYSQSNDSTTLTLTDSAGTYVAVDNTDGWGAPNTAVTDVVVSTDEGGNDQHLLLDVSVTDKNGTETTYTTINLYDQKGVGFAGFTTAAILTWTLTPADFVSGGTAMGLSTDKLDDGVYDITYSLKLNDATHSVTTTSLQETVLVDGDVKFDVYNKLRQIPIDYAYENIDTSRDVMEALLSYAYLKSIEKSESESIAVSRTEEVANMLYTLDKLISDGSHYTW